MTNVEMDVWQAWARGEPLEVIDFCWWSESFFIFFTNAE